MFKTWDDSIYSPENWPLHLASRSYYWPWKKLILIYIGKLRFLYRRDKLFFCVHLQYFKNFFASVVGRNKKTNKKLTKKYSAAVIPLIKDLFSAGDIQKNRDKWSR